MQMFLTVVLLYCEAITLPIIGQLQNKERIVAIEGTGNRIRATLVALLYTGLKVVP